MNFSSLKVFYFALEISFNSIHPFVEIIPWVQSDSLTKRSGKKKEQQRDVKAASTLMDRYVAGGKRTERDEDIDDQ